MDEIAFDKYGGQGLMPVEQVLVNVFVWRVINSPEIINRRAGRVMSPEGLQVLPPKSRRNKLERDIRHAHALVPLLVK